MAKTKTKSHSKQKDILHSTTTPLVKSAPKKSQRSIEDLLTEAATLLEQSQPELALPLAEEALRRLETERQSKDDNDIDALLQLAAQGQSTLPEALAVEAEIQLALGDADSARRSFLRATQIDPNGALVSAEPWLWLAQLCEGGGRESISYFEKAIEVLRNEIDVLEDDEAKAEDQSVKVLDERKAKLADALCAMAEVYMTDLSWEEDAEQHCEQFVTEAVAVCPDRMSAGVLQTLASVRISQERFDDARQALRRSVEIWKDIPADVDDEARPNFATRVSLSRLLMEVEAEAEAMTVLEGLVREDDQSVECWYLGGWCQVLMAQKPDAAPEYHTKSQEASKIWLDNCLRLYRVQDYEDDRLKDHALELVQQLNKDLGMEDQMDDDEAWEDEEEQDEDEDGDLEVEGAHENHADGDVEMS
ncbi:NAD-dependent histone deacetylase SIR2 [Exophiala viscosa]|uniref:NAD-dependent histone deacetylase SIR2 n=1 Tax=Exophiala viscosa TaxID=2486360 RepID=A0AAN6E4Y9_9EURO|nr:NAD-dependent histone deacetylase SIR2 [Exophiala viscosa]KAI1629728.1 NAD-dependent histone deacetylase SIR2 [Exophiala viscosa]